MVSRTRGSAGWLVAAVVVPAVVVVLVFGLTTGACYDAVPGSGRESHCTTGPMVGVGGAWILCTAAGLFALYAVSRAVRRRR